MDDRFIPDFVGSHHKFFNLIMCEDVLRQNLLPFLDGAAEPRNLGRSLLNASKPPIKPLEGNPEILHAPRLIPHPLQIVDDPLNSDSSDPLNSDSYDDGLCDLEEYNLGLDTSLMDRDGATDAEEACHLTFNRNSYQLFTIAVP